MIRLRNRKSNNHVIELYVKIIFFTHLFVINSILYSQNINYNIENIRQDFLSGNYKNISSNNDKIKLLLDNTDLSDIDLLNVLGNLSIANIKQLNHENALFYLEKYVQISSININVFGKNYLTALYSCVSEAKYLNDYSKINYYSNLGLKYIEFYKVINPIDQTFFFKNYIDANINLSNFTDAQLASNKFILFLKNSDKKDDDEITEAKFNLAISYFSLNLLEQAELIFQDVYNSSNSENLEYLKEISFYMIFSCKSRVGKHIEALNTQQYCLNSSKKKYGKKSNVHLNMLSESVLNFCGIGEVCRKSKDIDSILLAEKYFKSAIKLGLKLVRENKNNESLKIFTYGNISLSSLFIGDFLNGRKYAELSKNNSLLILSYISEKNYIKADSVFYELMKEKQKEYENIISKVKLKDKSLLKDKLNDFITLGLMNYLKLREQQSEKLNLYAFNQWINFNGHFNIQYSLNNQTNSDLTKLKQTKNLINESPLTPIMFDLLSNINDSISIIEQKIFEESTLLRTHKKINYLDVKNQLKENEVFIDILEVPVFDFYKIKMTDRIEYHMFLVKKDDKMSPEHIIFSEIDKIELLNIELDQNNSYIYSKIWKVISNYIGTNQTIYVSPGGVFNNINFNTIYNPESQKYFIQEKDIRIVNSAKDFILYKENSNKIYTSNSASLFGFANFDGNDSVLSDTSYFIETSQNLDSSSLSSLTRGGMKVKLLPSTKIEVEKISTTLNSKGWTVNCFISDNASESNLKKQQSPRVLHLATHGYFLEDIPKVKDNLYLKSLDNQQFIQDPMLRSGLLLTNANKTLKGEKTKGENGLFSAEEASLLDLKETQLVVLSACETGKGEVKNSEGVFGLRKAFKDAGAQNIIMSLWKVDDKITQEFMSLFYEIWLNDKTSIREAFHKTQIEVMAKYPQPYYWGAFILVGN